MTRLNLLLIEDHAGIARQVATFVDGLHWQLDHAATGALGVQLAASHVYDVVLLDLNLPDIDGLEVSARSRRARRSNVPILMLTARDAYRRQGARLERRRRRLPDQTVDLRELALRCEALARRRRLHVGQAMRARPVELRAREGARHYGDLGAADPGRVQNLLRFAASIRTPLRSALSARCRAPTRPKATRSSGMCMRRASG